MKHSKRMIRTILLTAICMLVTTAVSAQSWQGTVMHNGYACRLLKSLANHTVLAAKSVDAIGYEILNIKFRIPYRWDSTATANVKVTQTDLNTGQKRSADSFFDYRNGWVYVAQYLICGDKKACHTYTVTVYRDNDWGQSGGDKQVYTLYLDRLDTSGLPINDNLDKYW